MILHKMLGSGAVLCGLHAARAGYMHVRKWPRNRAHHGSNWWLYAESVLHACPTIHLILSSCLNDCKSHNYVFCFVRLHNSRTAKRLHPFHEVDFKIMIVLSNTSLNGSMITSNRNARNIVTSACWQMEDEY